jgi:hypothetical protein
MIGFLDYLDMQRHVSLLSTPNYLVIWNIFRLKLFRIVSSQGTSPRLGGTLEGKYFVYMSWPG